MQPFNSIANHINQFGEINHNISGTDIIQAIHDSTRERRQEIVDAADIIFSDLHDTKDRRQKIENFVKAIESEDPAGKKLDNVFGKIGRQVMGAKKGLVSEEEAKKLGLNEKEALELLKKHHPTVKKGIIITNETPMPLSSFAKYLAKMAYLDGEDVKGESIVSTIINSTPKRRQELVMLANKMIDNASTDSVRSFLKEIKNESEKVKDKDQIEDQKGLDEAMIALAKIDKFFKEITPKIF